MIGRGWVRAVVPALFAGLLVTGCTSTVVGTASPAETTAPSTTEGGPTPTETPVEITPPPPVGVGTVLESHRIASVTSLVPISFPSRTESCFPAGPQVTAADLDAAYFGTGTVAGVLDRYGFVAAWGQCGSEPDGGPATLTMAMEVSDPEAAVLAADELVADQVAAGYEEAPIEVDGGAVVLQEGDEATVQAFVPVGRMIAYLFHETTADAAAADVEKVLTDQVQLLAGFTPTPQADVPALPADPQGLSAYTLDPPGDFRNESGPYDLEGYLRLAIDPVLERDLLTGHGFTGFYTKQSDQDDLSYAVALYTFPTLEQAYSVHAAFAQLEVATFGGTPFQLPQVPTAPCFHSGEDGFYFQRCYVAFNTFLASVDVAGLTRPDDLGPMSQLLPAQVALID
ncbi:hypothetical protein ACI8AF_07450 [Blastococcus sp. SYSU D00669]